MSRSWERPFFALILLISVFALPVSAAPQWSNPVFAPENHSVYVPSATYTFYITWSSEAAVSLIEANFTGTYANYTATKDGTTYYYSIRDLGAGGYGIRFYANNSTDNTIFNVTSPLNYTVAKAQPITKIYINNSESGEVTIENNTGALLAADLLNTTILTSNFGFEVGRTTDPSLPNGWTYGDIFTYSITDSLSWTWNPLYSLDNFTGARSLLYNFSDNNPNHAAYFVRSNFFPINNSMNYTIIAYVKPNMTFNASRGKPSTYGLWIDFTTLDEFNNFDSPDGTAGVLLNNTDIFIDRAEDNPSIIRETKMEDASKEGWKKVTILLNSSNIPSTSVKGQITFGSYDLVYDGTVLVDDIMVLGEGQRLNKTVNISSNLTGFGQDKAGTPLLSNETRVVGTGLYNITSFFLEDQNYSFASEAHNLISGLTTSMTVTSENSSYSQTTGVGIEQFNAKIIVNYTNSSGFVIAGPSTTCRATTNVTDSTYILAYSSGSKTYNLTIPTDMLFGSVLISVTCSGNRTYMPNTTSTTFGVWQNMYFRENDTDVSFANGAYNTTRVFNSSIPSTSNWYISNLSVNTSTTTGSLARFVLLSNGTNGGYGTEYLLKGNASIRGNISVNDSSLEYYPCLQHYDSEFNLVEESCGSQRVKAANNTYGVDEFEVFVNLWEPKSGEYLAVDWRYNWTGEAGIGASFNITYNSSLETPNVVIYSAQPLSLKITEYDPVQQSTDYTVSSLQEADALFSTKISFNNTQSIRIRRSYNYLFPIYDANISFVTVRSSTNAILNNTITHINEGSITHTILGPLRSSSQRHRTSFTSEQFTAAGVKNETVAWTCINCIHAAETLTRETLTVKQWNVSVHSHLTSGKDIHNVTAITDYSAYGAYSGWAFAINVTNSSGMLDVTNQSTIYSNNTIKLPKTKLSTVIFTITATGKSNGVACTASNECATNNCCGSVCSSSCTVTNTVSGSGGGGGISTTSRDVIIQSPSAISVPVGKENILYINITNNVPATKLNNVTVKLSGYLPGLAEVEQQLDGIEYNETRQLKILLKAPIFLTGTYDLKVIIEGKLSGAQSKTITQEFVVKLTATSLTIGDAEGSVNNAAAAAKELSDAGIGTKRIEDLLSKAKASLADGDYATASSLANQAVSLKDKALSVKDALEDVSKKLEEAERAGLDVSETARYYSLAAEAFAREEFEKAEQRLNAASLTYVLETQGKINVVAFAYNNWYWILAFLAVSYVTGKAAHRRLMLIYINFMLKSLKDEERAINELLTETQNQFYREKTMDEPTYHKMMYEYEKRLTSMKKTMGRLIIMKARIISAESELEELEHEEEHVIDMTKELQTLYYKDRKINKHIYDRRQNEYHERRAEIREQIELLKEKMNLKKKKGSSPLFAILPLFLLIVPIIAFADLQGDAESALLSAQQDIDEMSGKGLSVISLSKLLDEARKLYNAKEYDGVILLTDQINATKSKALSISSKIDEVEGRMIDLESKGADVAPIRTELTKASAGLYGEEYAAADAAVEKAAALLEDLEGSFATSSTIERTRLDVIKIIYQNWLYITAFLIVVAATWRAAYIKLDTMRVSKRIEYLEYAEKHLKELMVRNQEAYYKEKTISKPDFLVSRDYYNKRMSELAREMKVMMERLQKLKSMESSSLWLRLLAKRK